MVISREQATESGILMEGGEKLCFNPQYFARNDFDTQRFVEQARRRASLEQLHTDLRLYLRSIQNSMVKLINEDYADFLNLSSNLAGLRESIAKLSAEHGIVWDSLDNSISEGRKAGSLVEEKSARIAALRRQQIQHRNKIALLLAIERLSAMVKARTRAGNEHVEGTTLLTSWLRKLQNTVHEVELWRSRCSATEVPMKLEEARKICYTRLSAIVMEEMVADLREDGACRHVSSLLSLLSLVGQLEPSVAQLVSSPAIREQIGKAKGIVASSNAGPKKGHDVNLRKFYDEIFKVRSKWISQTKENEQYSAGVEEFLDRCLLHYTLLYLEENATIFLVPSTDRRLFHRCFAQTISFISEWPSRAPPTIQLLKSIKAKFNLLVYFKLETQDVRRAIKEHSQSSAFSCPEIPAKAEALNWPICPLSGAIMDFVDGFFLPEDVFILPLADKAWSFLLKALNTYAEWLRAITVHLATSTPGREGHPTQQEPWVALIVLSKDAKEFSHRLADHCEESVFPRLRQLTPELQPYRQCLSLFDSAISARRVEITRSVQGYLTARISQDLTAVSEIPRQYRWTKRATPTAQSPYLETAFTLTSQFSTSASKLGWSSDDVKIVLVEVVRSAISTFCGEAEKVLDLVEQTGSSLERFKRKMTSRQAGGVETESTASSAQPEESDDSKIRNQIMLDARYVRDIGEKHLVTEEEAEPLGRLVKLEQRAKITAPMSNVPK